MKFAFADPPYMGSAVKHYGKRHQNAADYDRREMQSDLIQQLQSRFPDGWALAMSSTNLRDLLPLCPPDVRVSAWVKPFAIFKPNVNPGYCWEPLVWRGGRKKRNRSEPTVRDYLRANITLETGVPGAKPPEYFGWVFDLFGAIPGQDEIVDLFPGSDGLSRSWDQWCRQWYGLFPATGVCP